MAKGPQRSLFTITTLKQAHILADTMRLRLLREFVDEPRTTKQVADRLGEPAPKLYRHVDALLKAGFLERAGERRKRGTTERYLQAVASRFEVDRSLFSAADRQGGKTAPRVLAQMIREIFKVTQTEFLANAAQLPNTTSGKPILMRVLVRGSQADVQHLRDKLKAWIDECQQISGRAGASPQAEYAGLIAFYSQTRL